MTFPATPSAPEPGDPYVGPRSFRFEDGRRFFGRTLECLEITSLWQANRLTVLYGSSGVGKTSLIQAGVLPRLSSDRTDVLPIGRVTHGSAFPLAALAEHNPYTFALLSSWAPEERPTRLSGLSVLGFLRQRGERVDRYGDPVTTLIAIDQAEELFSDFPHRQRYREPFIEQLVEALDEIPTLRLLLSIRAEFLASILPYEQALGGRAKSRFELHPLTPDSALEAVTRPLEGTRRRFAPDAAEKLVTDLRTVRIVNTLNQETTFLADTVEPVQLQVVCSSLWRALPTQVETITTDHIRRYADVDDSLRAFCDRVIEEVAADHYDGRAAELRSWLQRTFVTELGTRGTAYEGLATTAGMPNAVVRALVDRHLLRVEVRSGSRWCELQHDRLIQPLMRGGAASAAEETGTVVSAAEYLRAAGGALADGELTLAAKHAEEALRLCGDDIRLRAEAESFLGNIAYERRSLDDAMHHYRTATGLFEAVQDTAAVGRLLTAVGRLLVSQGRYAEAIDELQSAARRLPNDLAIQTELGKALRQGGRPQAAVAVLDAVLAIEGGTVEALRARGQVLVDLGRFEDALRDLERVRRHHRPATRAAYALALAALGRWEEVEPALTAALAEADQDGPALLYAARVRRLQGDPASAAELARRAEAATAPPLPRHLHAEAARLQEG